ncbi:hypothetical protein EGI22_01985 [Lacihabitans sp. LS3-19]|uniref:hypothetical protein n=1 Tax=Lacihabitans sp. LS3-19 TaxID=2487335 RepID=UPI0020CD913C|nr:hypothetical protein [Lacihabitans sp. LS3-19]MCP9766660.1 hypothetical protein [Lacihabitans sp. LS3-19]
MAHQINISGDFSTEEALKWKKVLNVDALKKESISIDMVNVRTADITGINALATTQKILLGFGKTLSISVKKNSQLANLINLTKLNSSISVITIE